MYKTFEEFLRAKHESDVQAAEKLLELVFELEPQLSAEDPELDAVYIHQYIDIFSKGEVVKLRWTDITADAWNWSSLEVWMDVDEVGSTVRLLYHVEEGRPESYSCYDFPDVPDRELWVFCRALGSMRTAQTRS